MHNIVFLHGALGSPVFFQPIVERLGDKFFCHTLSFSGHANENFYSDFSIQQFSAELDRYMESLNLTDCTVFGHSMGGYVALHSNIAGNHKIRKIITLGTKFFWNTDIADRESGMLDKEILKIKAPSFIRQLQELHGDNWEILLEKIRQLLLSLGRNPVLTNEWIRSVKIPVSICLGEKDRMVTPEESEHTASLIREGKFLILKDQPHQIERTDPKVLAKLIEQEILK